MNILVIARSLPWLCNDNDGIFELEQARALSNAGHRVSIAAIDIRSIFWWRRWGISKYKKDGVFMVAVCIPCGRSPWIIQRTLGEVGFQLAYNNICQEMGKPDIIHGHFTDRSSFGLKVKLREKIPLIVTEHSSLVLKNQNKENSFTHMARNLYKQTDRLIVVSPHLGEVIREKYQKESAYIPNILDVKEFQCKDVLSSNTDFGFVLTANLVPEKKVDLAVLAFANVFGEKENVHLTIFGDGPERSKLEAIINNRNISDKVILRGFCSRYEIANELKKSQCFVLPSEFETFGLSYVEALATGTPVIATCCGGPETFVNNRNGILIPINDSVALENAMRFIYKNNNTYDVVEIAENARNKFSAETVTNQIITVYKEILK